MMARRIGGRTHPSAVSGEAVPMTHSGAVFDRLPDHLRERARVVRDAASHRGEFVLYWMHHAARGHENPALDAAVVAANHLHLPVVVYQGLAGRHRFNSDRHHRFILEGARDAAQDCARRGVRHVFHLPTDPAAPSPLRELARAAALLVVEEFPAPPFPRWTEQLLARSTTPAWAVDAACVVPMHAVARSHDRAFTFRDEIKGQLRRRLNRRWHDAQPTEPAYDAPLPFEPLDWDAVDLDERIALCEIDHTIGPVPHTRGGSVAGYRRWNEFKESGLVRYAERRNNAAIDGVSRLSPYLHHGHVAATRIAREANQFSGEGPEKFLDELVIWRELSHNFVLHRADRIESIRALPGWARATLSKHATDRREAVFSWESLARGGTGDRLWDAAQRSLVRHGELHNNVRMTWGKSVLGWTRGPAEALRVLIDLNHRFALDGSDPNSYAGLLWALGALDRPFTPERPVLGTVRPRDTGSHSERLDLQRYEGRVDPPASHRPLRIAVIGAGLAGATAARALHDQGHSVVCFDKARGPGGRMSTRSTETACYDHGAVYFTVRDERFRRHVDAWVHDGLVAPWNARFAEMRGDKLLPVQPTETRYVGTPGMNAVVAHLTKQLEVRWRTNVTRVVRSSDRWTLATERTGSSGDTGDAAAEHHDGFDELIVAVPAPQARALVSGCCARCDRALQRVEYTPTITALVTLRDGVDVGADGIRFVDHASLGYATRIASKPNRTDGVHTWVLHASHGWSARRLEDGPADAAAAVFEAFADAVGVGHDRPVELLGHRWRYAFVRTPAGQAAIRNVHRRLTLCGDWALGPRVEHAYLSGAAAAGRVLAAGSVPERPSTRSTG